MPHSKPLNFVLSGCRKQSHCYQIWLLFKKRWGQAPSSLIVLNSAIVPNMRPTFKSCNQSSSWHVPQDSRNFVTLLASIVGMLTLVMTLTIAGIPKLCPKFLRPLFIQVLLFFGWKVKVQLFWEGHKNWRNLHRQFDII